MKLQTSAGQLHAALRQMAGIVSRRVTTPVLSAVKFEAGRVIGTDLDNEASVTLATIGTAEGSAAIDFFGLSALAAHIDPAEQVTIVEDGGAAKVSFNGSEYQMASFPASDFPVFGDVAGTRNSTGNLGLVAAIRRIGFAMSSEQTRYYLNGVAILQSPEGQPIIAATDGHRLAYLPLDGAPEEAFGAIIWKPTVHLLARQKGEPVAIEFNRKGNRIKFEFPGLTLSAKLVDGKYPDIFMVIPRDPKPLFSVDRKQMLSVAKRMRSFSWAKNGVKLVARTEGLRLELASFSNRATECVDWSGAAPEPFECGYNLDYLISAFAELSGDVVTFSPAAGISGSPVILSCEGDPLRIVQMPMRV
ncbi:hypothetical protein WHT83_14875 [Aminobacter sp. P9b]|uniref:DNA polymerase III subunit beta n=1 Tax=Aminobacter sp. P9b TaxID=3133697 RepID=UPI003244F23B